MKGAKKVGEMNKMKCASLVREKPIMPVKSEARWPVISVVTK